MRSSLEQKLDDIKRRYVDVTEYSDLSSTGLFADQESGGRPGISIRGNTALKNAIRLWVMSRIGDYDRNPNKGGSLDLILSFPVTKENQSSLKSALESKFKAEVPYVGLINLQVNAKEDVGVWQIILGVADLVTKQILDVSVNVKV